jgi:hypothetical protein
MEKKCFSDGKRFTDFVLLSALLIFRPLWLTARLAPSLSRMGFDRVYPVYYEISFELETESERDL